MVGSVTGNILSSLKSIFPVKDEGIYIAGLIRGLRRTLWKKVK
jgi:hypothetical protein